MSSGESTMPLVRVKQHFQITLPASLREQLRLEEGDLLEATIEKSAILLTPKAVVDREEVEGAIEEGLRDYAEGRVAGPFDTVEEFTASLKNA
jgi:AbrB family looped-hinge helix DNA binding protein